MKIKQLMKQLWNEKRSIIFLFIELLLVFIVLWYILDWTYEKLTTYLEPVGFDITDTYLISLEEKDDKCIGFISEDEKNTTQGEDIIEVMNRLKRLPEVDYVCFSRNSRPYTGSNSGYFLRFDTLNLSGLSRSVTPDFFHVFRYKNLENTDTYSLTDRFGRNKVVVGENLLPADYKGDRSLKGKLMHSIDDSTKIFEIVAVTQKVRYNDFWPNYDDKYIAFEISEQDIAGINGGIRWYEVSVRVKPGVNNFEEYIMKVSDNNLNFGNLFILNVESYEDIRINVIMNQINSIKTRIWMLGFLLINILLGIIGTFWFRTQHRKSEMGLRIALGATKRDLWNYLNQEGLVLLSIAAIPGIVICYMIGNEDLASYKWNISGFIICIIVAYLLMTIMILLGIWYPAYQVMKTEPADALREE